MMSELNKDPTLLETISTQTFILKKRLLPSSSNTAAGDQLLDTIYQQSVTCKKATVVFNPDRKYYTPTFIDPSQREAVGTADERLKEAFIEKMEQTLPKKCLVKVQKLSLYQNHPPISALFADSNFPIILMQVYLDNQHVAHPVHRKNAASSGGQELVENLIEEFGRKQRRAPTVGFGQVMDASRKRCKMQQNLRARTSEELMFKDHSTCLPNQIQTQIKFRRA